MNPTKQCIYCAHPVILDKQPGYVYAYDWEHLEIIEAAHSECAEMTDNIKLESPQLDPPTQANYY